MEITMLVDLRAKPTSFEIKQNHLHFRKMFLPKYKYVNIMSYSNIKIYLFSMCHYWGKNCYPSGAPEFTPGF